MYDLENYPTHASFRYDRSNELHDSGLFPQHLTTICYLVVVGYASIVTLLYYGYLCALARGTSLVRIHRRSEDILYVKPDSSSTNCNNKRRIVASFVSCVGNVRSRL
jgi:hypothetical protein